MRKIIVIFVSAGVLINEEEIIKRDSREIVAREGLRLK